MYLKKSGTLDKILGFLKSENIVSLFGEKCDQSMLFLFYQWSLMSTGLILEIGTEKLKLKLGSVFF